MTFEQIIQFIGITTFFPLLLVVGLMLFVPVVVYEDSKLPAGLLALLTREIRRRHEDKTEELSLKTLERLEKTIKTYEKAIDDAKSEDMQGVDAVVAALTDNAVDAAFLTERRGELQLLALKRLETRCEGIALTAHLIERWPYWVQREHVRLWWLAGQDVGVKAFQYFLRTLGRYMTEAGALGLIGGILIWGMSLTNPGNQPEFWRYLSNSGALGAFLGLAYALVLLIRKAWKQYIATIPADERRRWRRSWIVVLAFWFGMGPALYFDLFRKSARWVDRLPQPVLDSERASDILVALFLAAAGGYFAFRVWGALRNWRTPGILSFPQRLEELSFAILGIALAVLFLGLPVVRLVGDSPAESRYIIWWGFLIYAVFLAAGGVGVIAGLARYRERRSRMRMFKELGLQPKRFLPIWLIGVIWLTGIFFAVPITALLILVFAPGLAEQDEIPSSVIVTLASVLALVAIGGTVHIILAKRRRKLEDGRLITEYRRLRWSKEAERPGEH